LHFVLARVRVIVVPYSFSDRTVNTVYIYCYTITEGFSSLYPQALRMMHGNVQLILIKSKSCWYYTEIVTLP